MVVRTSIVYLTNIELGKVDCENCIAEIRLAENAYRKIIFRASGTTVGCYCDHYFLHYKDARHLEQRENR
jgi:hypothetical protein